jgi:hypothetical protein
MAFYHLTLIETGEGVLIKPAEVIASETLDEIGRVLTEKGVSLEKLVERGREIREDLIEEEYDISDS